MYNKASEIYDIYRTTGKEIWEIALIKDEENIGIEPEEMLERMKTTLNVMKESAYEGLDKSIQTLSGITGGNAIKVNHFR
ncbi:MAG: hypothetical protein ACLSBL_01805, partial [Ezakiella massiliensis]